MKKQFILNIVGVIIGLPSAILATIQIFDEKNLQLFSKASLTVVSCFLIYLYLKLFYEIIALIFKLTSRILLKIFSKKKKYGVVWKYSESEVSAVSFCPRCNIQTNQLVYGSYEDNSHCAIGVKCSCCESKYLFLNLKNNPYPVDYAEKEMQEYFFEIRRKFKMLDLFNG